MRRRGRVGLVALLVPAILMLGVTGCEASHASQNGPSSAAVPPPFASFAVRFDPSVFYDDALRDVTDIGLQPSVACGFEEDLKAGRVITDMHWQPAGQRSIFLQEHRLFVILTPLAPPDWNGRVTHMHGFRQNTQQEWRLTRTCPDLGNTLASPSAPGRPVPVMVYGQAMSSPYARVVFTPSTTYAEAVYTISDLGLRLADPCYERKALGSQSTSTPWPGAGQEQRFAASHSLIVAASPVATPVPWEQMLSSQAGVADSIVPYTTTC